MQTQNAGNLGCRRVKFIRKELSITQKFPDKKYKTFLLLFMLLSHINY